MEWIKVCQESVKSWLMEGKVEGMTEGAGEEAACGV